MDISGSKGGVELAEIKQQLLDLGAPEDLVQDWSKVMKYLSKSEDKEKMRGYLESLRGKLAEAPAEIKEAYNKIIMHFDAQIGLFSDKLPIIPKVYKYPTDTKPSKDLIKSEHDKKECLKVWRNYLEECRKYAKTIDEKDEREYWHSVNGSLKKKTRFYRRNEV